MHDLRELYQDAILDHSKHPRNFGAGKDANRNARGNNPLCGDRVEVHLLLRDGRIEDVQFEGRGCAISLASASMMTEMVKGKTEAEARALFSRFHHLMTAKLAPEPAETEGLDSLMALSGVRDYPMRVKCATLAWHTLTAALDQAQGETKTE